MTELTDHELVEPDAALREELAANKLWWESAGEAGEPAYLADIVAPHINLSEHVLASATIVSANLVRSSLIGAILDGAVLDRADLSDAHLIKTSFRKSRLRDAVLRRVVAGQADFSSADVTRASFDDASLIGVAFVSANCRSASFRGSDLERADLRRAIMVEADYAGANVQDADVDGARIDRATMRTLIPHVDLLRGASVFLDGEQVTLAQAAERSVDLSREGVDGEVAFVRLIAKKAVDAGPFVRAVLEPVDAESHIRPDVVVEISGLRVVLQAKSVGAISGADFARVDRMVEAMGAATGALVVDSTVAPQSASDYGIDLITVGQVTEYLRGIGGFGEAADPLAQLLGASQALEPWRHLQRLASDTSFVSRLAVWWDAGRSAHLLPLGERMWAERLPIGWSTSMVLTGVQWAVEHRADLDRLADIRNAIVHTGRTSRTDADNARWAQQLLNDLQVRAGHQASTQAEGV